MFKKQQRHMFIPDIQAKAGVPLNQCEWIGKYIQEKRPNVVINAGDHTDCPSLSTYDRGKEAFEGRRYQLDIKAGLKANHLIWDDLVNTPEWLRMQSHILYGNHEHRITRFVQDNPELAGFVKLEDLKYHSFYDKVHDFLMPVVIDGVAYCHYFYNMMSGRPYGSMVQTRLKQIGFSFTMGHQQGFDYAQRTLANGTIQHGLIAGACYLHYEDYKGPQANDHWRGLIIKDAVHDGMYDIKVVSLESLCRRYEGVTLSTFMKKTDKHIGV